MAIRTAFGLTATLTLALGYVALRQEAKKDEPKGEVAASGMPGEAARNFLNPAARPCGGSRWLKVAAWIGSKAIRRKSRCTSRVAGSTRSGGSSPTFVCRDFNLPP